MTTAVLSNNKFDSYTVSDPVYDPDSYRCHLAIIKEEEGGGFSVIVLNLPGAGSCGDSVEEVVANAREAVVAVIESYLEDSQEIPWQAMDSYQVPEGAEQKWILVDA